MLLAKMPIFGFLIILLVWVGNAYYEGLNLEKTGEILQNGVPMAKDGVLI